MVKEQGFKLESTGKLEFVIVRCPTGHRLQGMKTDDLKVRQTIACPECKAQWTVIAPLTNGFEASV
jgi:predicted Zn-ribbon and HTH transcriptional regulator